MYRRTQTKTNKKSIQEDTAAIENRAEGMLQERLESHIHAIQAEAPEDVALPVEEDEVDWGDTEEGPAEEEAQAPMAAEAAEAAQAPMALIRLEAPMEEVAAEALTP